MCYGNQQQQKKRINQLYPDQTPLYAASDQEVHGLGINLSDLGPTNRVDQNKKEEEENGCGQAVHSFGHADCTWMFCSLSVFTHVTQTDYYQTTITDDSC